MIDGAEAVRRDRSFLMGWVLVLLISAFLGLSTLYVLMVPVDEGFFEDVTARVWEDFAAANPAVAENMERENRLLGVSGAGLSLFALAVTWSRLRRAEPWAAWVMWILPLTLTGFTALFVVDGIAMLAVFYAALAIGSGAGLILVLRALRGAHRAGAPGPAIASEST